jgi:hypothetical protein
MAVELVEHLSNASNRGRLQESIARILNKLRHPPSLNCPIPACGNAHAPGQRQGKQLRGFSTSV